MAMAHVPEIGAENRYQKTGTINRHETTALSYSLRKTGTGKILYQNACQMCQKSVPVFQYWFLASISGTCVMGIIGDNLYNLLIFAALGV